MNQLIQTFNMFYNLQNVKLTVRSPDIFAPARIPVAAGKKMAKTEKNVSSSLKSGPRFSKRIDAVGGDKIT